MYTTRIAHIFVFYTGVEEHTDTWSGVLLCRFWLRALWYIQMTKFSALISLTVETEAQLHL